MAIPRPPTRRAIGARHAALLAALGLAGCGNSAGAPQAAAGTISTTASPASSTSAQSSGGISLLNHSVATVPGQLLSASVLSNSPAAASLVQATVLSGGTLVGVSAAGQNILNLPLADILGGGAPGAPNLGLAGGALTQVAGLLAQAPGILPGRADGASFLPSLISNNPAAGGAAQLLSPLLNTRLAFSGGGDSPTPLLLGTPGPATNSSFSQPVITGTPLLAPVIAPILGGVLNPVTGLVGGTLNGLTKTLNGILVK